MSLRYPNVILGVLLLSTMEVSGQMAMPDNASVGETRRYYVLPGHGSTYRWWINGIIQSGFTTNEFVYTWNAPDTFLLEVQEISSYGCTGQVRSGLVIVSPLNGTELKIPKAFSPNADLINDVWNIRNYVLYPNMEITIFNRWGQAVWKSGRGYPHPWDGRSNGKLLPVDSYHYVINLHNGTGLLFGMVTIVR